VEAVATAVVWAGSWGAPKLKLHLTIIPAGLWVHPVGKSVCRDSPNQLGTAEDQTLHPAPHTCGMTTELHSTRAPKGTVVRSPLTAHSQEVDFAVCLERSRGLVVVWGGHPGFIPTLSPSLFWSPQSPVRSVLSAEQMALFPWRGAARAGEGTF
jgi:hypothetical protein